MSQAAARSMDGTPSSFGDSLAEFAEQVIILFVLLIVTAAAAAVTLLALDLVEPEVLLGSLSERLGAGELFGGAPLPGVAMGSAAVGLLALGGLMWRFRGRKHTGRSTRHHLINADDRGFVLVDSKTVATIVQYAIIRLPGVVDVEVDVRGRGLRHPIQLVVDVFVHPGATIRAVGEQAREEARAAVEQMVGVTVQRVVVDVHIMEEALGDLLR